jgi:hypothetical protein
VFVGGGVGLFEGGGDALPYRNRLDAGKYLIVVQGSENLTRQATRILRQFEPENIQGYSKSDNSNELSKSFFKILPVFDSISVTDSIFLFHSINSIYFLFKEIECLDVKLPKSILKKYDKTQRYRVNEGIKNQTKKVIFNTSPSIEVEKKTDFNKTHRIRSEKSKTRKYKL